MVYRSTITTGHCGHLTDLWYKSRGRSLNCGAIMLLLLPLANFGIYDWPSTFNLGFLYLIIQYSCLMSLHFWFLNMFSLYPGLFHLLMLMHSTLVTICLFFKLLGVHFERFGTLKKKKIQLLIWCFQSFLFVVILVVSAFKKAKKSKTYLFCLVHTEELV